MPPKKIIVTKGSTDGYTGPQYDNAKSSAFFSTLGNAGVVKSETLSKEYGKLLADGEHIQIGYKLIRDVFIFTDKRLILVDVQGLTGTKIEYHSIAYKSISRFSVETAGQFDLDAELKIWVSGQEMPIKKKFNRSVNIYDLQQVLASHVL